jgi:hypothetical protein
MNKDNFCRNSPFTFGDDAEKKGGAGRGEGREMEKNKRGNIGDGDVYFLSKKYFLFCRCFIRAVYHGWAVITQLIKSVATCCAA